MPRLANKINLNNKVCLRPIQADLKPATELNDLAAFISYDFLNGRLMAHGISHVRPSRATVPDYQGNLVTVDPDTPAFYGAVWRGNGWDLFTAAGLQVHPLAHFFFRGKSFHRLAHYEAWPGATTAVSVNKLIAPGNGTWWKCTASTGNTGGIEPADWSDSASPVVDGDVTWTYGGLYQDRIGLLVEPLVDNKCECFAFPLADALQANIADTMSTAAAWGNYQNNTIVDDAGEVKITMVDDARGGFSYFNSTGSWGLSEPLVVGKIYQIDFKIRVSNGADIQFVLNTDDGDVFDEQITNTSLVSHSAQFRCTNVTGNYIQFGTMGAGESVWISSITVQEVKHAIGTKATAASPTAIEGYTVSGDANGFLHIRAATAAEIVKFGNMVDAAGNAFADKMYENNNAAGASTFWCPADGVVGNVNKHSISVHAYSDGTGYLTIEGGTTLGFTNTTPEKIIQEDQTPSTTGKKLAVGAPAGSTVSFLGPNLVEAAYASSPILTSGASATRAAVDTVLGAVLRKNDFTVLLDFEPTAILSGTPILIENYYGSNDWFSLYYEASAFKIVKKIGGSFYVASAASGSIVADVVGRYAARVSSVDGVDPYSNGDLPLTPNANTSDLLISDITYIGRTGSGISRPAGLIKNLSVIHNTDTGANMQTHTGYDGEA